MLRWHWAMGSTLAVRQSAFKQLTVGQSRGQLIMGWVGHTDLKAVGFFLVHSSDCNKQAEEVFGIQQLSLGKEAFKARAQDSQSVG